MIPVKAGEIRKMEKACQLAARALVHIEPYIKAGVTTDELDKIVHDFTLSHDATPAPLNYNGFPKSICTSINNCICHGVPGPEVLKDGDLINVDVTCIWQGYFGDTSRTFFVGNVSARARELAETAEQAMYKGIDEVAPGATTGDIGFAINKFTTKKGFHVVREIGGHGIGNFFHGEPFVPSYGKKGRGETLIPWLCLTVEPMINETDAPIRELPIPNSSIRYYETGDGTLSAQYEHTLLVTDKGHEILTRP